MVDALLPRGPGSAKKVSHRLEKLSWASFGSPGGILGLHFGSRGVFFVPYFVFERDFPRIEGIPRPNVNPTSLQCGILPRARTGVVGTQTMSGPQSR